MRRMAIPEHTPAHRLAALTRPPWTQRTRIKICGLTREADVDAAVEAGADAIGFVLYDKSPRHVTLERAAALAARLPPFVTPVLLFVNARAGRDRGGRATRCRRRCCSSTATRRRPSASAPGRPYLRAARMAPGFDLLDFARSFPNAQALLLDAHVEGYGGGGKVFDWSLIPPDVPLPVVLSGGLNACKCDRWDAAASGLGR